MAVARALGPINEKIAKRFWSYVDIRSEDECWLYKGLYGKPINRENYGMFSVQGLLCGAHRVAYAISNGGVPEGRLICHKCDVPACVNPRHLYCGTYSDNASDRIKSQRVTAMCTMYQHGVPYWKIAAHYGVSERTVRQIVDSVAALKDG